jgi:hypothetical protein
LRPASRPGRSSFLPLAVSLYMLRSGTPAVASASFCKSSTWEPAARLMGAIVIVTGLSAEVAQALVALGVDLGRINTIGDLQGGLEEAERLLGYKVVPLDASPIPRPNI